VKKSLRFFCTAKDARKCFEAVEAIESVNYYRMDSKTADGSPESSIETLLPLLESGTESGFLIARPKTQVRARKVQPTDMEAWYAFDQLENPDTVTVQFGMHKGGLMTPGTLSTLGQTDDAVTLFRVLATHFKKECVKVKAYLVGPEALGRLRAGHRLAISESSSQTYDLRED
jgi:hypothetical protein